MSNMPAGGLIPSGIGGCIATGNLGDDLTTPDWTEAQAGNVDDQDDGQGILDIGRWVLETLYELRECPHSGCLGAIARRLVAYDFRFNLEVPYDYNNPPDELLVSPLSCPIRFNLADVTQEPLLRANDAQQRFYIARRVYRASHSRARCSR